MLSSVGRESERIERAGGRAEMPLGQMQVDGSDLEVLMTEQYLDSAQVGAGFEQVRGEAMSQSVGMNTLVVEASALSSDLAGAP